MTYVAIYNDNYLAHHGVKGMKWGVRRSRTARLYSEGSGRKARVASSSGEMTAEQRSARRRKIAKGIAIGVGSAAAAAGLAYAGSKYLKSDRGQQMLRKAGNRMRAAKGFASTAKNTAKTYAKSSNIARAAGDAGRAARAASRTARSRAGDYAQSASRFARNASIAAGANARSAARRAGNYANAAKGFARTAGNTARTYAKSSNIARTAKDVSRAMDRNTYGRLAKRTAAFVAPAAATAAGAYAGNKVNQAIKNRKKKRR